MIRREFITLLGGAAVAGPVIAHGQKAMPVVGFLHFGAPDISPFRLEDFHRGLSDAGIVVGRNVTIEYRWAEGRYERLSALAADLVRRNVAVIAAIGPATPGSGVPSAVATAPAACKKRRRGMFLSAMASSVPEHRCSRIWWLLSALARASARRGIGDATMHRAFRRFLFHRTGRRGL